MKKKIKMRRNKGSNAKVKIAITIIIVIILIGIIIILYEFYNYKQGEKFQKSESYERAISHYQKVDFVFNEAKSKENECYYQRAIELREEKDFDNSILYFEKANNYNDSQSQIQETKYQQAIFKYNNGEFKEARKILEENNSYKDSLNYINNIDKISLYEGIWIEDWDEMLKLPDWQQYKNTIDKEDCNILIIEGWNIKEYQIADWGDYNINEKRYNLIEGKTYTLEDNFLQQYFMNEKYCTYFLENNLLKLKNNLNEISYIYTKYSDDFNDIEVNRIKEPKIGMTKDEVINSTWGKPEDINKTTTRYGTSEQWCYSGYKYIYFEDGKVTSIQD